MAYRNGFLTGVPGVLNNTATPYVSAISYQPSGLVAEVDHGKGTKELWAPDPSGMARPCSISVYTPPGIANNTLRSLQQHQREFDLRTVPLRRGREREEHRFEAVCLRP